eukprot:189267_1
MSISHSISHFTYTSIIWMLIIYVNIINGGFIRGESTTNWTDAKAFCEENYDGLATINNAVELAESQTECFKSGFSASGCWIGLTATIDPDDQTVTNWEFYEGGLPETPSAPYGGIAVENEIYLIGPSTDAWVLDLDTNKWSTDDSVSISDYGRTGQSGAAIKGEYYFTSHASKYKIQKYVPGYSLDPVFASLNNDYYKCFTANQDANILYIISGTKLEYLDVTSVNPPLQTSSNEIPYSTDRPMCAYLDAYIYVFGSFGRNEISRINVGVHNEYFYSATWHTLTTVMPDTFMHSGQAVVATNGKIFIGAMMPPFADKVYEFSPEDQIITEIENFKSNDGRPGSAFVYSEYGDRIYALAGYYGYENNEGEWVEVGLNSWECSNIFKNGGICSWTWNDNTSVDYGFNKGVSSSPLVGHSPWYTDRPNGCGDGISNEFCVALGASGAACEQLWDNIDCKSNDPFPLCNIAPSTNPTTYPTTYPSTYPTTYPSTYPTTYPSTYPTTYP